jgi:peptide/nickel transport system ATP-binding protein
MTGPPILDVQALSVSFPSPQGVVRAVRRIGFTLGREKLGIVGESGSGKSMTGRAILKLTPPNAIVEAGAMRFRDIDLVAADERAMRKIRGARIGMILQDPKYALNPVQTAGRQIAEAFRIHRSAGRGEARDRTLAMLEAVRIRNPARVFDLYPHEVSGGMGQRIMIAMMLIPEPDLLIADEPTSALDVTVRLSVLRILDEQIEARGLGLIFISHDLNLVATFCDRVLIMYAGRIVESLPAASLHEAAHPYTRGLLESLPRVDRRRATLPVLTRDPAWLDA